MSGQAAPPRSGRRSGWRRTPVAAVRDHPAAPRARAGTRLPPTARPPGSWRSGRSGTRRTPRMPCHDPVAWRPGWARGRLPRRLTAAWRRGEERGACGGYAASAQSTSCARESHADLRRTSLGIASPPPLNDSRSHAAGIVRSAATLRRDPVDVLRRILDVACLAVHAVLRVDLQLRIAFVRTDDFVNAGRTIACFRTAVALPVQRDRQLGIGEMQMTAAGSPRDWCC